MRRINDEIDACNAESGLSIQLFTGEPGAFGGITAHYGMFTGVKNYIALVGRSGDGLEEKAGWYGERLVLLMQTLGINSCWVAATFSKGRCKAVVNEGERLVCVIALGYGKNQGRNRRSKKPEAVCSVSGEMPGWFMRGVEAALLAPTAVNQQKFHFELDENRVSARATGGFYSNVDLGIVKYHFEVAAGKDNFIWA